jgi:hypothetical protein
MINFLFKLGQWFFLLHMIFPTDLKVNKYMELRRMTFFPANFLIPDAHTEVWQFLFNIHFVFNFHTLYLIYIVQGMGNELFPERGWDGPVGPKLRDVVDNFVPRDETSLLSAALRTIPAIFVQPFSNFNYHQPNYLILILF